MFQLVLLFVGSSVGYSTLESTLTSEFTTWARERVDSIPNQSVGEGQGYLKPDR